MEILTYDDERLRPFGKLVYREITEWLIPAGIQGYTVVRGVYGLDRNGHFKNAYSEYACDNLPVSIQFFAETDVIGQLNTLFNRQLKIPVDVIEVPAIDLSVTKLEVMTSSIHETGGAALKVYLNGSEMVLGRPLISELVRVLKRDGAISTLVYRGLSRYRTSHDIPSHRLRESIIVDAILEAETAILTLATLEPLLSYSSGPAVVIPVTIMQSYGISTGPAIGTDTKVAQRTVSGPLRRITDLWRR
ncbi:DUF190 domain-containing protein [Alicyclobacillus sp. ALC3]|uniref:DUF190 domain-containing protein n=1 Tax=Alicyclobacillus sp. ALC3 TaxID=2796143 RepID=UPI0023782BC8|nr:DUF190 domain-containing protein [Alicyclobacillus sp. ALC3]WDL99772.1 DUF190 domain-containing protein [Alicyclobacillus sp. ALC3]